MKFSSMLALLMLVAARVHASAPPAQRLAFAVVIGNNHSLEGRRPDLRYADDDAAKYFDILQTIAPGRVTLLADFDADSARLFPEARARASAPTRAALLAVGRELAAQLQAATAAGQETDLYFIFAGHGDIDQGSGFIELADARFTAGDLETWLRNAHAARAHVILDSCNSFFMLGARRPGGRYYATPEDAVRALSARLPDVGVFLSTSAEGDAFEWSEIQSGVFSHVVRSGLLGAADADGDGAVDYRELAAFVSTATADVKNPNMRPHVFARGPGGNDRLPIVTLRGRTDTRELPLSDARSVRLRLRNRDGVPLLDAHTEANSPIALALPNAWADGAELERAAPDRERAVTELLTLPSDSAELRLAALPSAAIRGSARGPAEIFQTLFARPFGPRALAAYLDQAREQPAAVFGVSREHAERMRLLLDQIASAEHDQRVLSGTLMLGLSGFYALYGGSAIALHNELTPYLSHQAANFTGAVLLGLSGLSLGYGTYSLLSRWNGERLAVEYGVALSHGDYAAAFALANDRLRELGVAERRSRWFGGILGGLVTVGSATAMIAEEATAKSAHERLSGRTWAGLGILLGLSILGRAVFMKSPTEQLLDVWQRDAKQIQLQPTLEVTTRGASVGVTGRF